MAWEKHLEPSCSGCLFRLGQVTLVSLFGNYWLVNGMKETSVNNCRSRKFSAAPPPPAEPAAQESFLSGIDGYCVISLVKYHAIILISLWSKTEPEMLIFFRQVLLVHTLRICMKPGPMIHPLFMLPGMLTSGSVTFKKTLLGIMMLFQRRSLSGATILGQHHTPQWDCPCLPWRRFTWCGRWST